MITNFRTSGLVKPKPVSPHTLREGDTFVKTLESGAEVFLVVRDAMNRQRHLSLLTMSIVEMYGCPDVFKVEPVTTLQFVLEG